MSFVLRKLFKSCFVQSNVCYTPLCIHTGTNEWMMEKANQLWRMFRMDNNGLWVWHSVFSNNHLFGWSISCVIYRINISIDFYTRKQISTMNGKPNLLHCMLWYKVKSKRKVNACFFYLWVWVWRCWSICVVLEIHYYRVPVNCWLSSRVSFVYRTRVLVFAVIWLFDNKHKTCTK